MWPYACLSDCKVMVKCVESDGKVIATHVSVQSHCQPVRPDREGCCDPSCVCHGQQKQSQAAPWVHALPAALVRWVTWSECDCIGTFTETDRATCAEDATRETTETLDPPPVYSDANFVHSNREILVSRKTPGFCADAILEDSTFLNS